jgi:hypothetical protein
VADAEFRAHIASDAAWLRALVEGVDVELLVNREARLGLPVEL